MLETTIFADSVRATAEWVHETSKCIVSDARSITPRRLPLTSPIAPV